MNASILQTTEEITVTIREEDYAYTGRLAGLALKRNGAVRYVVEDHLGRLFIHSARQLGVPEGWMPT